MHRKRIVAAGLVAASAGGLIWVTKSTWPPCPMANYDTMVARAIALATAPSLHVSHLGAERNRYAVRYRGYESTEAFLQKNPNCCEDVTEETRLEGIPPDEMRRLRIATAIKVTSTWSPIAPSTTKDYVRRSIYYFDKCGNQVSPPANHMYLYAISK